MNQTAPNQPDLAAVRRALRDEWEVTDESWIVAALSDWPQAIDAVAALMAVGLAAETGRPLHLLIHPQAPGVRRAITVAHAMGRHDRVIVDDRAAAPWACLGACDAAVVINPHAATSPAVFEAAGLPVIGDGQMPAKLLSRQLAAAYDARLTQPTARTILGDLSR